VKHGVVDDGVAATPGSLDSAAPLIIAAGPTSGSESRRSTDVGARCPEARRALGGVITVGAAVRYLAKSGVLSVGPPPPLPHASGAGGSGGLGGSAEAQRQAHIGVSIALRCARAAMQDGADGRDDDESCIAEAVSRAQAAADLRELELELGAGAKSVREPQGAVAAQESGDQREEADEEETEKADGGPGLALASAEG